METFEITFIHWLLVYSGLLFHLLIKLRNAKKNPDFTFSWKVFYSKNWPGALVNLFGLAITMILLNEWVGVLTIPVSGDEFNKLGLVLDYLGKTLVFMIGYFGANALMFIINLFASAGKYFYEKLLKRFIPKKN